eukprot:210441-Pyramimonas_sp.AAC.1
MIFDLIAARHLDLSSIGLNITIEKHCGGIGRFASSWGFRPVTELVSSANRRRMIRRVRLLNPEV